MEPLPSGYNPSILERNQRDIVARLELAEYFSDVSVFLVRPRGNEGFAEIQQRIEQANTGVLKKAGKTGLSVQVLMPLADTTTPGAANPTLKLTYAIRFQELVPVNMGPIGTKKSAEEAALEALSLLHNFMPGPANAFFPDPNVLSPSDQFLPLVTYDLRLSQILARPRAQRCVIPLIAAASLVAPQEVTLTSATAGAAIYYTIDGSYPSSLNEAAELYAAPFNVAAPCTLRAAAEKDDLQQSDIAEKLFT